MTLFYEPGRKAAAAPATDIMVTDATESAEVEAGRDYSLRRLPRYTQQI